MMRLLKDRTWNSVHSKRFEQFSWACFERPVDDFSMLLDAGLAKGCKGFLISILEDNIF